ncbi:pectinesterase inhibitor 10-like [Vigna umbellata]|uniref:pectinesterase inhibitor 10-like n=1 Tax=Vigna umbellata TaxID=87088 RepID=UPI001F5F4866|nr:pectinesterase inhibitor 10-like [Vigna umbellata]XP_047158095.1 pectinesterase inhibitor 10-like [Vigna umbellata]
MAPKKQGSRKKGSAASSRKSPSTSSCPPTSSSGHPTSSSGHPTSSSRHPTSSPGHPTSSSSTRNASASTPSPPNSFSVSQPVPFSTSPPVTSLPSASVPSDSSPSASSPSASTVTTTTVSTSTSASATTSLSAASAASSTLASAATSAMSSLSISDDLTITDEIPIKLNGMNYLEWNEKVEAVLKARNLLEFVEKIFDPEPYASESDRTQNNESEKFRRWFVQDQILRTWLLSSMRKDLASLMAGCQYSWQVWETVKELFHSHLAVRVWQLRSELGTIRKGNLSVSEYVGKIQSIVDSLAETGNPVSEEDHVEAVLAGLPREFDSVVKMARMFEGLTPIAVSNIETWCLVLEEKYTSEYRHVDGGGGPSTQDDEPSCSPECSTAERGRGSRRRRGHGRGGRHRGRN